MERSFKIGGQIVDLFNSRIFSGNIYVEDGKILDIVEEKVSENQLIMPGFVDAHIHIESSMLTPSEFARIAVTHGTVAAVCDPHEIANVLGADGVKYMINNAKKVPLKFFFGAPSCVPATSFETSGAVLDYEQIEKLMAMDEIKFLGEMMNYPGVILGNQEVMRKIESAHRHGKPVDGHAPMLSGDDLKKYANAGITTDHECSTAEEALEKISLGMKILIREGSAAANFDDLINIIGVFPKQMMFCSDDRHPDDLMKGHVNLLVKRAIEKGFDILNVLKAASINPISHYKLEVGMLRKGDAADFIVVDNFNNFNILQTYINGELVAEKGKSNIPHVDVEIMNNFKAEHVSANDFKIKDEGKKVRIIEITEQQLLTNEVIDNPKVENGCLVCDTERDLLKIAVINRYEKAKPVVGFIKGFGLVEGAIASSVAHDSHNIIVVGCSDEAMANAVNQIVDTKGGIAVCSNTDEMVLPLSVAGLMSADDGMKVANDYQKLLEKARKIGTKPEAPFITLSFMALLVIPSLKLSDKGLFDAKNFRFVPLLCD